MSIRWDAVDHPDVVGYRVDGGVNGADVVEATSHTAFVTPDCQSHALTVRSLGADGSESVPSAAVAGWPRPMPQFLWPAELPAGDQTEVTINGVNFHPGATVEVDDAAIAVGSTVVDSCYQMRVTLSVGSDATLGQARLYVLNADRAFGNTSVTIVLMDRDDDGVVDLDDNCPETWNPSQDDLDADGVGNLCEVPSPVSELVAFWPMDPATWLGGCWRDLSGNGFDLCGSGAHALADPAPALESSFTLATRIFSAADPPSTGGELLRFTANDTTQTLSLVDATGGLALSFAGLAPDGPLVSDAGWILPGQSHDIAVTHGDGALRFYVDGQSVGALATTHTAAQGFGTLTAGEGFDGQIDDLRLYRGTLSHEAVVNLDAAAGVECADADGDQYGLPADMVCSGGASSDCDALQVDVHPFADEWCDDGVDQDCNGLDLECGCLDADFDGSFDGACGGTDCDDADDAVHPAAVESCNAVDDDCDGFVDEGSCGPIAWWTMDGIGPDGSVDDASGEGHALANVGAEAIDGLLDGALEFQLNQNDYLESASGTSVDLSGPFTIAGWINPDTFGQNFRGAIVDTYSTFKAEGYALRLNHQSGLAGLEFYGLMEQSAIKSAEDVIDLDIWQHIAVIYDGNAIAFYVNGQPAGSAAAQHDPRPTSHTLRVGNNGGRSYDFDGMIDDLRIYDRALDLSELERLVGLP